MTPLESKSAENASPEAASLPTWDVLDQWVRDKIQEFIQSVLEEEMTELLGRGRHERKPAVDAEPGYRNGHGKPRRLTLKGGTVTVRRPRARGLDERFESRVLPLFKRRTKDVGDLLPELYLHGLAERDFDLALRGLLGDDAPLSASTVARLKDKWHAEHRLWSERRLDDLEVVYLWADGVYVKAGLEKEKACLLVLIAALSDGRKVVLAVEDGQRESTLSWKFILCALRDHGMRTPRLVVGDGAMGLWAALDEVFPEADQQRCWNHKMANVLDPIPKKQQAEAKERLRKVVYAETVERAERARDRFLDWALEKGWDKAAKRLSTDWDRMTTFYRYPKEHWRHLRTTNIIESPFATVRLRTNAAKRYKKSHRATAVIWKTLLAAEKSFRRLNEPEKLKEVIEGAQFQDGIRIQAAAA
jgi:transposase-like protein